MEDNMDNKKIDKFLENKNMTYLFLLLANLEVERLNNLPFTIKSKLKDKITHIALDHVASNEIPDYVIEEDEETLENTE